MFKSIEYRRIKDVPGRIVKISSSARRYNAFPKVVRTKDTSTDPRGALLAAWYSGNAHVDKDGDGQIWGAFSTDEGITWSAPFLVYGDPSLDCRNISIARAPNGDLILFLAKVQVKPCGLTWLDFGRVMSGDHGRTWGAFTPLISKAASIVPGAANGNGYGDPVVMDGTIYIACYGNPTPPSKVQYIAFVLASSDNGKTWHHASTINAGTSIPASEADFCMAQGEHGPVLFGFTRTARAHGDLLHYFESTDQGRSWSSLIPTNAWGHSPDVERLADGRYIVAYRARTRRGYHFIGYFLLDARFPVRGDKEGFLKGIEQRCLVRTALKQPYYDMAYPSLEVLGGGKLLVVYYDIAAGGVFGKVIDGGAL